MLTVYSNKLSAVPLLHGRPLSRLLACAAAVPPLHGRPLSRLLGCASAVPPLHGRPLSRLLGCAFAVPPLHSRPLSILLACAAAVPPLHGRPLSRLLGCAAAMPPLHGRPLSKVLGCHHQIVGRYILIVVIAVSLSLLQYVEPPPAVAKDHLSGQLIGGPRTSSSKAQHSWQHAFQVMVTTQQMYVLVWRAQG